MGVAVLRKAAGPLGSGLRLRAKWAAAAAAVAVAAAAAAAAIITVALLAIRQAAAFCRTWVPPLHKRPTTQVCSHWMISIPWRTRTLICFSKRPSWRKISTSLIVRMGLVSAVVAVA